MKEGRCYFITKFEVKWSPALFMRLSSTPYEIFFGRNIRYASRYKKTTESIFLKVCHQCN